MPNSVLFPIVLPNSFPLCFFYPRRDWQLVSLSRKLATLFFHKDKQNFLHLSTYMFLFIMGRLLIRWGHKGDHESFTYEKLITLLNVNSDRNATHHNTYPAQLTSNSNISRLSQKLFRRPCHQIRKQDYSIKMLQQNKRAAETSSRSWWSYAETSCC